MEELKHIDGFEWDWQELQPGEREASMTELLAHLEHLIKPGMRVLDLCCGGGAGALLLAQRGISVLAVDASRHLLELARAEAERRGLAIDFKLENVLEGDYGAEQYDLVLCLGNAVLDFPPERFNGFRDTVHRALKPGGCLALEYYDGFERCQWERDEPEKVMQETPQRVTRYWRGYDPARGACRTHYHNETLDERCDYLGFVYTAPLVKALLEPRFINEQVIALREDKFLGIYRKR